MDSARITKKVVRRQIERAMKNGSSTNRGRRNFDPNNIAKSTTLIGLASASIISLALSLTANQSLAQTLTYNAGGGGPGTPIGGAGVWDLTTTNWDNGAAASFADGADVIFGAPDSYTVTITTPVDPGSVTFNANDITIAGGTMNDPGTITVSNAGNTARISSAIGGTANVIVGGAGSLLLTGASTSTGFLVVGNTATLNLTGSLSGGVTNTGGTINLLNGSTQAGNNFSNSLGTVNVSGTVVTDFFANFGTTTVAAGAGWTASGGVTQGNGTFTNNGTVNGGGTVITGGTLVNNGQIGSGNVILTNAGNLTNDSTITSTISTTATATGTLINNGTMSAGAGFLIIQAPMTFQNSGTVTGNVTNVGTATLLDGTNITGQFANSNAGTVTIGDGTASTITTAVFFSNSSSSGTIAANATLNATGGFTRGAGGGTFTNNGTINGSGVNVFQSTMINNGHIGSTTVTVGSTAPNTAALTNNAGGTIAQNVTVRNGATLLAHGGTFGGGVTTESANGGGTFDVDVNTTLGDELDNDGTTDIANGVTLNATVITNDGTIDVGAGSTLNGTANTLNNNMVINIADGGALTDNGAINNNVGGTINFAGAGALDSDINNSGGETVTNSGIINLNGNNAQNVQVGNLGNNDLINQGNGQLNINAGRMTIGGLLSNSSVGAAAGGDGGVDVNAGGILSADTISNLAGGEFTNVGTVTATAGMGITTLSNAGTFTNSGSLISNSGITNTGTFNNTNAISALAIANSATGTFTSNGAISPTAQFTNDGTLNALGSIGVLINNNIWNTKGGTLTINGNATNNGALDLQNGATTDAITVNGNFAQNAGDRLMVDVDTATATGDTITVTGTAAIDGFVDVNFLTNNQAAGITILSATGGVTNNGVALGNVTGVVNPLANVALGFPNANDVTVEVTLTAIMGQFNRNQTAIMNNINGGASPQTLTALLGLGSASQTASALDRLSPELYLHLQTSLHNTANEVVDDLFSCHTIGVEYAFNQEGNCVWLKPQGREFDSNGDVQVIGFTDRTYGLSVGTQWSIGEYMFAGLSFGYEVSDLDAANQSSADTQRYHIGGALKYVNGPVYLGGGVVAGMGNVDSRRNHLLGTNNASVDEQYFAARLRAAYLVDNGDSYAKPMVDLNAAFVNFDGFTESGTAATALSVSGNSSTFLSVNPALEFGRDVRISDGGVVRGFGKIGVTYQSEGDLNLTAGFAGAPAGTPSFQISTQRDSVFGQVEAGLLFIGHERVSLELNYQGRFSADTTQHGAYLKGALKF